MLRSVLLVALLAGCDLVFGVDGAGDARVDTHDAIGGLLGYWTMNTVSDGTTADASGAGRDAHCFGAACPPGPVPGTIDSALPFDGMTTMFVVPGGAFETQNGFTATQWLYMEGGPTSTWCPVNKVYGSGSENSWQLCVMSDHQLLLYMSNDTLGATQVFPLESQRWTFVAVTYDTSTGEASIIVDGLVANHKPMAAPQFDDAVLTIGADIDSGGAVALFTGSIDETRVYSRPLTPTELMQVRAGLR